MTHATTREKRHCMGHGVSSVIDRAMAMHGWGTNSPDAHASAHASSCLRIVTVRGLTNGRATHTLWPR